MQVLKNSEKSKKKKIAKKRSFKKFTQLVFFWVKVFCCIILVSCFLAEPIKTVIKDKIYSYSAKLGFLLSEVVVDGSVNSNINSEYIHNIVGKKKVPILSLDIQKIQNAIMHNSWVKDCYVYVSLPSTLKIVIQEKEPLAIWQNKGKLYIIDKDGIVITSKITSQYQFLPIIVGSDANINATQLFSQLSRSNELMEIITASIYVGSRRWDIIVNDDIVVNMPEENFSEAYSYLISLYKDGELLKLKKLDLRDGKKYYRTKSTKI
jgi:cell division protein FtsQ